MSNESWPVYTLKFIGWITLRVAADCMLSGLRNALNFVKVAKNFYDGDKVRGVINLLYGVLCLFTFGALSAVKDVAGQSVKEAVGQVVNAKSIASTAERRASNEVGKDLVTRDLANVRVNEAFEEVSFEDTNTRTRVRRFAVSMSPEGRRVDIKGFSMTRQSHW